MRISKILVANRGEIAIRIIKTCDRLGIDTVAVYSDVDSAALHVRCATQAYHLPGNELSFTYLNTELLITAAKATGAEAIHPGYGFLSENADFAHQCVAAGLIFIGPRPEVIAAMGSKSHAKATADQAGVPTVPGYYGTDQSTDRLIDEARRIGMPVLLKAAAGGGGRGMRLVRSEEELVENISAAQREAKTAFGSEELLIEKYIESSRHIEFQILADNHGNVIHLLERECTIQRRYQKIIEESPSPVLSSELRQQMGQAAVTVAKAIGYNNIGTIEFLFDSVTRQYYFLEVNTRIQVEHPVTEAIIGMDLVEQQIAMAEGAKLTISQKQVIANGYAIECRICAEDPSDNYLPSTGVIHSWQVPVIEGLRMDSGVEGGSEVSIYYDSMLAKLIIHDRDRLSALRKMRKALASLICMGVETNIDYLASIVDHPDFIDGSYDTHFLKRVTYSIPSVPVQYGLAACFYYWYENNASRTLLKQLPSQWSNNPYRPREVSFQHKSEALHVAYAAHRDGLRCILYNQEYAIKLMSHDDQDRFLLSLVGLTAQFVIRRHGARFFIHHPSKGTRELILLDPLPVVTEQNSLGGYIAAMPSNIVAIKVETGSQVKSGDPLIITSSMKMETTIYADQDGVVSELYVVEGQHVEKGSLLISIT